MNMPGFTAEASLVRTGEPYALNRESAGGGGKVEPQYTVHCYDGYGCDIVVDGIIIHTPGHIATLH